MSSQRPLYVISNWDAHFESYESKRLQRCSWVPIPNKHDGKSFRRVMREKDAAAIYGAWVLAVQVASKCPVRGILADLDGPLDSVDLEDKTGIPADIIERMTEIVTSDRIGWLTKVTDQAEIDRILTQVSSAARGKQRKANGRDAGTPADSDEYPQSPANSGSFPQTPADSDHSPQSAGAPAGSRKSPQSSADCRTSRVCAGEKAGKAGNEIPPIVPQGGLGKGADAVSKPDHSSPTCPDSDGKKDAADVLAETKKKIGALFGRQSLFFGHDAERALSDLERAGVLPLPETDWVLLEWWFSVPKDEKDSDLRARRQTAETLACNLLAEIDRARGYAKKPGAPAEQKKNGPAINLDRLQAWFAPQWPDKPLPRSLDDLPEYLRDEARKACTL